jgi:NAD(P)-dependent dehydrogenase (short-subunit alcohol dehydrogenase family)
VAIKANEDTFLSQRATKAAMGRLADRHVVVTGGGTGIGRAIAERLAKEGAVLTLLARDRDRLDAVGGPLGARTDSVDVRDADAVRAAFERAVAERGGLYALVANAGIGGPNASGPEDRFEDLVATNLLGTYRCVRAAEPLLADGGRIVVTSSILARIGVAGYTGYCASKAGLLGLVRALAVELAPRDLQVNAICPGWVDTEMSREGFEALAAELGTTAAEAHAEAMKAVPRGRMAQPEEIAGTVAWLLSDEAGGVTGQAIDHNGGAWMG